MAFSNIVIRKVCFEAHSTSSHYNYITIITFCLQVSFPPYIFEVLLYDVVDEDASVARIENGMILFTLKKKTEGIWGQLCSPIMGMITIIIL